MELLQQAVAKAQAAEEPLDHVALSRIAEQVEFLKIRALRDYDRRGGWQADGFLSAAAAVRAQTNVSHGAALRSLRLGQRLESLPETAAAFAAGDITRFHAEAITDACTPERRHAIADVEGHLVEIARRAQPRELRSIVRRLTDALDGDGGRGRDAHDHARRRLHVSPTFDGMVAIDGLLDAAGGEVVMTALGALMQTRDERTRPQQRADALVEVCARSLDRGLDGSSRGVRPHVSVCVDVDELERRGAPAELLAQVRCDAANTGALSRSTLEWIACDCDVSRVITNGRSEVLDVGRSTRVISPALWKALVARDGGCTHPGCARPPAWCEAHHIVPWWAGGPTSLDNLLLRCTPHHHELHLMRRRE